MPERFLPFLPYLEFFILVGVWLPHIMEERDIMGLLCTVTDISHQYTPITATDINRHITAAKATLAATYYGSGHRHGGHKHIHGGHRYNGGGHKHSGGGHRGGGHHR